MHLTEWSTMIGVFNSFSSATPYELYDDPISDDIVAKTYCILQQQPGSLPPSPTLEAQPTRRRSSTRGVYGVQVNSGAPQIQHQRMMVGGLMSPGAWINPQRGQMQLIDDLQRQMISPAIQNMGLAHGMQIQHSNLTKDTFQGRQTTGVMNHWLESTTRRKYP